MGGDRAKGHAFHTIAATRKPGSVATSVLLMMHAPGAALPTRTALSGTLAQEAVDSRDFMLRFRQQCRHGFFLLGAEGLGGRAKLFR